MLNRSFRTWRSGPRTFVRWGTLGRPRARASVTPLDLTPSSQYPLSEELKDKYDGMTKEQKRAGPQRAQIVSPSLCDDALSLLGPSLEPCKGCDILDINPGAGLWSQKIHDAINPRSHIMLESNPALYGQYLQPLVEAPDSTYRMVTGDATQFETIEQLISKGYLPHQQAPMLDGSQTPKLNNSLLVTGTLMWDPHLPGINFTSMGKQLIYNFVSMSWRNRLFHQFGPVRMLFWLSHNDHKDLVPKSLQNLSKFGYNVQLKCDILEIVAPPQAPRGMGPAFLSRDPRYEFESLIRAMNTAKENCVQLPEHRRDIRHGFVEDIERLTKGTGLMTSEDCFNYLVEQELSGKPTLGLLREFVRDFLHKEAEYKRITNSHAADATSESILSVLTKRGQPKKEKEKIQTTEEPEMPKKRGRPKKEKIQATEGPETPKKRGRSKKENVETGEDSEIPGKVMPEGKVDRRRLAHPSGVGLSRARAQIRQSLGYQFTIDELVDVGEEMYKLECKLLNTPANQPEEKKAEMQAELQQLGSQFDEGQQAIMPHIRSQISSDLDDRLSLHSLSRLQWDERPFEPIAMQREEVWPPIVAQLALVTPKPIIGDLSSVDLDFFFDFGEALLTYPQVALPTALDNMEHGLSDIIKDVEELRDVEKGGRIDHSRMTVRMVTHDQLLGLFRAYQNWPFRSPGSDRRGYFSYKMERNV
ncbi:S-adenosyl-L-methionine-dependent methyltransferase [Amniculicola lignicola CBS 123094]|uniref:S-adenosyl-L-methionine-dependent methyltransferase n=1 Tax=Amniculicola lignicola CBS 123094 TaxID=1392246 RepID=A0A6A5WLM7_9PLEO|nr:S-adenosyl-L-methionine-dependent methyltransferase [Amniculicola lignicola CBS 123094]